MEAKYQKYKRKYLAVRARRYYLGGAGEPDVPMDDADDDDDVIMEEANPEWLAYLNNIYQTLMDAPPIPRLRRQYAERGDNIPPPVQPVRLATTPEVRQIINREVNEIPGDIPVEVLNRLPNEALVVLQNEYNWQTMDHITIRRVTIRIIRNILVGRLITHTDGIGNGPVV